MQIFNAYLEFRDALDGLQNLVDKMTGENTTPKMATENKLAVQSPSLREVMDLLLSGLHDGDSTIQQICTRLQDLFF